MKHLKTFEQVRDFYGGNSKFIITTHDEKYVVNSWGHKRGPKSPYLYPIKHLEKEGSEMFFWNSSPDKTLKDLNNHWHSYHELSAYAANIVEYEKIKAGEDEQGRLLVNEYDGTDEVDAFKIIEFQYGIQKVTPLNI